MSADHHTATEAAMKAARCERYTYWVDIYSSPRQAARCRVHSCWWDDDRNVCPEVHTAVVIGYEAGRRDALNEAADIASQERTTRTGAYHVGGNEALTLISEHLRALASTPTNEGADDART